MKRRMVARGCTSGSGATRADPVAATLTLQRGTGTSGTPAATASHARIATRRLSLAQKKRSTLCTQNTYYASVQSKHYPHVGQTNYIKLL